MKLVKLFLALVMVSNLSCVTLMDYRTDVAEYNKASMCMGTLTDKKEKLVNIKRRLAILNRIATNGVQDWVFILRGGTFADNPDNVPGNLSQNSGSNAMVVFRNNNDLAAIKQYLLEEQKFNAHKLKSLIVDLESQEKELSKVTFTDILRNKYNDFMKPVRVGASKVANWSSVGIAALVVYDLYFNKFELTEACVLQKSTSLLATLAIISHYLRK